MAFPGGHMRYLVCPNCGDPVAGNIPSGNEERVIECAHCQHKFVFSDGEIRSGIVIYDEKMGRWKVGRPV